MQTADPQLIKQVGDFVDYKSLKNKLMLWESFFMLMQVCLFVDFLFPVGVEPTSKVP
ncbi:hypothetical protein [Nostoc sp.]|uniref:hypothetical protein n=1 Tax=Nostoc sp. TaxID=1180 RepID=UPI002FFBD1B0